MNLQNLKGERESTGLNASKTVSPVTPSRITSDVVGLTYLAGLDGIVLELFLFFFIYFLLIFFLIFHLFFWLTLVVGSLF